MGIMFCEEGFPELPPRTGTYQQPPRKLRRRDWSKHPLPANIYEYACRALLGVPSSQVNMLSADVEFTSLIQQLYAARGSKERQLWNQLLQRVQELPPPRG